MTAAALEAAHAAIMGAKCPEDVFGALAEATPIAGITQAFRKLAPAVHPDVYATADATHQEMAQEAFKRLGELRSQALEKIAAGTYGNRSAGIPGPPPVKPAPVTIKSGRETFVVGDLFTRGDVCDLYHCETKGKVSVLKIAQHPSVNDLVTNEATQLRKLRDGVPPEQIKLLKLLPELTASFMLAGKPARRVNVLPLYDGYVLLSQVKAAYPGGIDFRDFVWMFKRALMALGFAHRRGLVHGAVLPGHLLVHPLEHGAKLIDWSYSVPIGERIKAISASHRGLYPEEVLNREPATPATDIYMLARCAIMLLGIGLRKDVPPRLIAFLQGCILRKPGHRPQDAWALHEELDALLQRLVGPPKYRPLIMPAAAGGK
jgi:hypothetical protein